MHHTNTSSGSRSSSSSSSGAAGSPSSSSSNPPSSGPPPGSTPPSAPPLPGVSAFPTPTPSSTSVAAALVPYHPHHNPQITQPRLLSLHLSSPPPPSPIPFPPPPPPPGPKPLPIDPTPDRPPREDCWSEGATLTLIGSWGDRYLELNRGNLKQKHWKDVADSVNRRAGGSKAPKTDVQCKNRLDTLKKKYKLEKSKIITGGGPSKWPFFDRLDELIGPSKKPKKPTPVKALALAGKRPVDEVDPKLLLPHNAATSNHFVGAADTISKSKESPDMTDSCPNGLNNAAEGKGFKRKRSHDSPFKDLAKAILKLGEVYERIETAKQQQLMDLEKQRMEFTKDLELQRLQLFMQTQVELAKMKHSKHGNTEHYL